MNEKEMEKICKTYHQRKEFILLSVEICQKEKIDNIESAICEFLSKKNMLLK